MGQGRDRPQHSRDSSEGRLTKTDISGARVQILANTAPYDESTLLKAAFNQAYSCK